MTSHTEAVLAYLHALQDRTCRALEAEDGTAFREDVWQREEGGGGVSRVLEQGGLFEKAGVNLSHVQGKQLPASATARRPELAGQPFAAMGVSLVLHPWNPYVPTTHLNVRFLQAGASWWFGGGYDLTPYYGFEEDARHWHGAARAACERVGADLYPQFKKNCDDYFYLRHREEARGIGGLFFDDWCEGGFEQSLALMQAVGDSFAEAYLPIVRRRRGMEYGEAQRRFQLYRRGRYVEFNLVHDRGTLFGLQSGGRTESILMSLPPLVRWDYDWKPLAGTPEADLYNKFLKARDWNQ